MGTNVQARMTAIHHVDVPWRLADVEQRDGRGMRQGNQNPELGIIRYVVERSFDSYMWQTIKRNARFISQIMRGRLDVREIDDIGDTAMSAAEAKALSSGNPLLLEKANADNELPRLQRLERARQRNLINLHHTRTIAANGIDRGHRDLQQLRTAVGHATDTTGDAFTMTVGHHQYDTRTGAAQAIIKWSIEQGIQYMPTHSTRSFGNLGTIGGFDVDVAGSPGFGGHPFVALLLVEVPRSTILIARDELLTSDVGIVRQLENRAAGIRRATAEAEREQTKLTASIIEADNRLALPFKYIDELAAAETRATAVAVALAEAHAARSQPANTPAPGTRPSTTPPTRITTVGPQAPGTQTPGPQAVAGGLEQGCGRGL